MGKCMSFLGFSITNSKIIPYKDKFDILYNDGGQIILVTKETYLWNFDESLPAFEYKYVIKCFDSEVFCMEQNNIIVTCCICPLEKYVNKSVLRKLDIQSDFYFEDMINLGSLPYIGKEYINYAPDQIPEDENGNRWYDYYYNLLDNTDFVDMLNVAATVLNYADSMVGFFLDKSWNKLGNTGWDSFEYLFNDEDLIGIAIKRLENKMNRKESK